MNIKQKLAKVKEWTIENSPYLISGAIFIAEVTVCALVLDAGIDMVKTVKKLGNTDSAQEDNHDGMAMVNGEWKDMMRDDVTFYDDVFANDKVLQEFRDDGFEIVSRNEGE